MKGVGSLLLVATLLSAGTSRAQGRASQPHTIALLPLRQKPHDGWWCEPDAALGELPNALHPRGTVLVLESAASRSSPTLSEWDLMTSKLVRSVDLPLPPDVDESRVVRAGSKIHVFSFAAYRGALTYTRLTPDFAIESQEQLGTVAAMTVSTDGSLIAVLWAGTRKGGETRGWQLVTIDAAGRTLGWAYLSSRSTFAGGAPMAVFGGKVYVLINDCAKGLPPIVRLSADARIEADAPVSHTPDNSASLFGWAGTLVLRDGCWFEKVDTEWVVASSTWPVPYRPEKYPWCGSFRMESDASGRVATTKGDVLSTGLQIERHFVDPVDHGMRALWVGAIPVLLDVGPKGGLSVKWSDP